MEIKESVPIRTKNLASFLLKPSMACFCMGARVNTKPYEACSSLLADNWDIDGVSHKKAIPYTMDKRIPLGIERCEDYCLELKKFTKSSSTAKFGNRPNSWTLSLALKSKGCLPIKKNGAVSVQIKPADRLPDLGFAVSDSIAWLIRQPATSLSSMGSLKSYQ